MSKLAESFYIIVSIAVLIVYEDRCRFNQVVIILIIFMQCFLVLANKCVIH